MLLNHRNPGFYFNIKKEIMETILYKFETSIFDRFVLSCTTRSLRENILIGPLSRAHI